MKDFDLNKMIAALCAAGLVFLFGKWIAEAIFTNEPPVTAAAAHGAEGDHGEEAVITQAYVVETEGGSAGGDGAGDDGAAELAAAFAAADAASGEKVFKKCQACHSVEPGKNGTGPSLAGIVGHAAGTVDGFSYSGAMAESGLTWDYPTLAAFLTNPKGVVSGTKMSFAGLKKPADIANVIAYLDPNFDPAAMAVAAPAEGATEEAHGDEAASEATETAAAAPAAGDVANGEKVFKKCKACHAVEAGKNGTGPSLAGIAGRAAGTVDGFNYSKDMAESGLTWDDATLAAFLANPKAVVAKTKMSFAGLRKESDIADIIAYLHTVQ